jgi:hypothetical protein
VNIIPVVSYNNYFIKILLILIVIQKVNLVYSSNNLINDISIGYYKYLSKRLIGYSFVVYITLIIYTLIFSIKRVYN